MNDELISVIDLATEVGKRKQTIFKIIRRLGIEVIKTPGANSRGVAMAYITKDEAALIRKTLADRYDAVDLDDDDDQSGLIIPYQQGVFYLLLLEPDHDPGRFKVGFATNLTERLRALRCSAPFTTVVKSWPCKFLWEKTAIDCVTQGCQRLHTEVFRTSSIEAVLEKCEQFFKLMPAPSQETSTPLEI